jgi:ubiquinone/menaquinone biosynthesis C-methylase UbiE
LTELGKDADPRGASPRASVLARAVPDSARPWIQKSVWKLVYGLASRGNRDPGTSFMNYGYASLEQPSDAASPDDDADVYGTQLYDRAASGCELTDRDVLEVGCGRGGGTAFVFDRHRPRSMVGLDLARSAITLCEKRYARPGLTFTQGDAENLPFPDGRFDVVLNVESSHCYPSVPRFLREVDRVLAPGGVLLIVDVRATRVEPHSRDQLVPRTDVSQFRSEVRGSPFTVIEEEDVTANVFRALQLDSPRRRRLIEARVRKSLQPRALGFAAVEGTRVYQEFASGELTYLRFVLRKGSPEHDRPGRDNDHDP